VTASVAWYKTRLKSMTERYRSTRDRWLALQRVTVNIYDARKRGCAWFYIDELLNDLEKTAGLR
jgi:hypothetical protein